jgi:thiol:disulfide interchange protein/DsbC/DsbD-like thiol-disulfide interchange protein
VRFLAFILFGVLFHLVPKLHAAELAANPGSGKAKHATVSLIAETRDLEAGATIQAGLRVQLEPHWHVYWKNPGDAGLPIRMQWELPAGFKVDSLSWPTPKRIYVDPLMNYGYEDEVVLPFALSTPAQAGQGKLTLKAHAKWLVCNEICLPEEAHVSLEMQWLTAGAKPTPVHADREGLAKAHANLPLNEAPWPLQIEVTSSEVKLSMTRSQAWGTKDSAYFYPESGDWMDHPAPEKQVFSGQTLTLGLKRLVPGGELPPRLRGVVATSGPVVPGKPHKTFEVDLPWPAATTNPGDSLKKDSLQGGALTSPASDGHAAMTPATGKETPDDAALALAGKAPLPATPVPWYNLLVKLALAFAGGLILNLMPCVLPVLSLKIFDFVQRAGHARLKVFAHGLTFTAGVLLSFWLLAGLLLILRQGGEQLGWGYQLQSPSFLVLLCALFFFFSLNLFGVFEMGYFFTRLGQRTNQGPSGHLGSFLAGVTATVVATPCTAPFMGTAMGFAFTQSAGIALLIFTSVGLGMASPYLVLAGFPGLMRFLPKPGEWMEHLKQFMGFPLLATAIWLAWILGRQAGIDALIALLAVLLLAGISAWILGKWAALHQEKPVRMIAIAVSLVVFLPAFVLVLLFVEQSQARARNGDHLSTQATLAASGAPGSPTQYPIPGTAWESYNAARLDSLLKAGQPVFIDFTADWCLSCKVNEKVALENDAVEARFRQLGITLMKGDWTRSDAAITQALAAFGRQSVPLYVLYHGPTPDKVKLLPELLTPDIVLKALEAVIPRAASPNKSSSAPQSQVGTI